MYYRRARSYSNLQRVKKKSLFTIELEAVGVSNANLVLFTFVTLLADTTTTYILISHTSTKVAQDASRCDIADY